MQTDEQSLKSWLDEFAGGRSNPSPLTQWIQQLADEDYQARIRATRYLLRTPFPVENRLREVMERSNDEEWIQRAKMILRKRQRSNHLIFILRVLSDKQVAGVLPSLFVANASCQTAEEKTAVRDAIVNNALSADTEYLVKRLDDSSPIMRRVAALALEKVSWPTLKKHLARLLADPSDQVKVLVARIAIQKKIRQGLVAMTELLESDDLLVRVLAASTLRQSTGISMDYTGYIASESRVHAIGRWKDWVASNGKTAPLDFGLDRKLAKGTDLKGHTLLAYGNTNDKVVEFDLDGQEVWHCHARSPRAAEKLFNGNVLISELKNNRVIEVNRDGKIVWSVKVKSPLTVYPLTNGNILVAQFSEPGQVVEINRLGEVVWRLPVQGFCCSAFPTGNDCTLISAYGDKVFEVNGSGRITWTFDEPQSHGSRRIKNGNTLISIQPTGRVVEVSPQQKIVWECRHHGAVDAFRLDNGNTLVSGHSQTVEYTPDKKRVWVHGGCQYGTARR